MNETLIFLIWLDNFLSKNLLAKIVGKIFFDKSKKILQYKKIEVSKLGS